MSARWANWAWSLVWSQDDCVCVSDYDLAIIRFADDEESLLREIRQSFGPYTLRSRISNHIYPVASYILKNVTVLRLDVPKPGLTGVSGEIEAEGELNFQKFEFVDISNILKEIERASSTEMDVHAFALSFPKILRIQKDYTMNFILLGPLAAFAMTHGVWLLVLKFVCTDSREEGIFMVLKRVEELFIALKKNLKKETTHNNHDFYIYISLLSSSVTREPRDDWKSMGPLYSLIKAMLEVGSLTHFILKDLFDSIPKFLKDEFDSLVLLCIYWIVSGVFICSSQCNKLPKNGYVIEDEDSHKVMDICGKLNSIHKRLMEIESRGKQYMDDEKIAEEYQIPNRESGRSYYALMALFDLPAGSEDLNLFRCDRKDMALSVPAMKENKILLLLISGLDISFNEINFLKSIYVESKTSVQPEFELIWLPIHFGQWIASLEGQYTKLLQMMPWLTIEHPNVMNERAKKITTDIWKFHKKSIIVVIREDGRVVCPNAIHLMHVWGFKAFPFTRSKERAMWSMGMRLDSLVLGFDPNVASMIEDGKWIVLYGGNDIKWISKFTNCIREVSSKLGILIEIVYVGKNSKIMSLISTNSPQSYSPGIYKIWYFWTRLESLIVSRYQTFSTASDNAMDPIIQEVKKLLSYASVESWACLILPSSNLMIHSLGDTMLTGFMEYEEWKQNIHTKEFPKFFQNRIEELRRVSDPTCSRIVLHIDNKDVVQSLYCPDCTQLMEKKIQYRCCHISEEL